MTQSRIQDFENNNWTIYRNACTTGFDGGEVVGVSNTQFKTDIVSRNSDSGGPYYELKYEINGNKSYIAGVHEGDDGNGHTTTTQARNVEIGFNLQI